MSIYFWYSFQHNLILIYFSTGFGVDTSTRSKYMNKRRQVFSLGSRGSEAGCFTWPRGVATGPGDIIAVADSSNHRVQVMYDKTIISTTSDDLLLQTPCYIHMV